MVILTTEEFSDWFDSLGKKLKDAASDIIRMLGMNGLSLGFPYSSSIKGSRHAFRELRFNHGKRRARIIYAFDPNRNALLILGGEKTGKDQKRFYKKIISDSEEIWESYLSEL